MEWAKWWLRRRKTSISLLKYAKEDDPAGRGLVPFGFPGSHYRKASGEFRIAQMSSDNFSESLLAHLSENTEIFQGRLLAEWEKKTTDA